jgi:hypothetical protein
MQLSIFFVVFWSMKSRVALSWANFVNVLMAALMPVDLNQTYWRTVCKVRRNFVCETEWCQRMATTGAFALSDIRLVKLTPGLLNQCNYIILPFCTLSSIDIVNMVDVLLRK